MLKREFGKDFNKDIKVYKDYKIPNRKIIEWSKEKIYCDGMNQDFYSVSYLDNSFNSKNYISGMVLWNKKGDLISELLEIISGMKKDEKRIQNILKN